MLRGACLLAVGLLLAPGAYAQIEGNLRSARFLPTADTLVLDTLSIAPGSLRISLGDSLLAPEAYSLDPYRGRLTWSGRPPQDTVTASYRVLPLLLAGPVRHKDPTRLLAPAGERVDPFKYVPPKTTENPFGQVSGLNKSGSISRGVLVGNNQDLSVNSTLNLELSGRLTDRIQVLASITDNNIPIQAGGNTLELQDFDQVFIKVFDDDWQLVAGDFVMLRPRSHFLTYIKKNKGVSFSTHLNETGTSNVGGSMSVSKGRFARNVIQGVEGVQGPYRLRGDLGEPFIVVLSGTERVFIDGQLMIRGQENDYVIDYNSAEVIFTALRPITKDRRIVVEFQYSDKNYVRTLATANGQTMLGRRTLLVVNAYSEQDQRNQPLQQQLSDEERGVLARAGDDPLQAVVPGADSVTFSVDEVLYARRDSLGYDPVYVFSTDPAVAHFRVTFTQVGRGNGDYVQQEFTPQGRVFRWVAPDTLDGVIRRNGDHAPVRVLIAPKAQRFLTIGAEYAHGARTKASAELAFSGNDVNTFSSKGDADNNGMALRLGGVQGMPLLRSDSTWKLNLGAEAELLSKTFRPLERYRPVEFERNWNAAGLNLSDEQLLGEVSMGVDGGKKGTARLGLGTFQVRDRYSGLRPVLVADLRPGRWLITGEASHLATSQPYESRFTRHRSRLAYKARWITIGYQDDKEDNRFTDTTGMLRAGSYRFHEWEGFVQSPDTFKTKWVMGAGMRTDDALRNGTIAPATEALMARGGVQFTRDPRNQFGASVSYRSLRVIDSTLTAQQPEDTYLGRVDYDLRTWRDALVLDVFYELNSGLEQRREFIYVQVPAGQGIYIWIDYNEDGIKQLNEFEVANFGYEADHIRVFTPSNTYVRTYGNQFSASLDLRPALAWRDRTEFLKILGKFSDMASFRTDRKTGTDDLAQALQPFRLDPTDSALTSYSSSVRNTVFYDRTSRSWSVDYTYQNDLAKSLLLNGFESRSRRSDVVRVRWNTTNRWTVDIEAEQSVQGSASDVITGRAFRISQRSSRPRITWQPSTLFRASASYRITEKVNDADLGGEEAQLQDLGAELRYNVPGKGVLQAGLNRVQIEYDGVVNSTIGNAMLTGLRPGTNWTWNVALQRNLSGHLQLDLTYNGRTSADAPAVHVGGVQVRAFF